MEFEKKVCYLGDDDETRAAAYLSGIMTHNGIDFDRVDSGKSPNKKFRKSWYSLYIISDYASGSFNDGDMEHIVDAVKQGAGLLMLGGWESYYGRLGEYHKSPLAEILPVVMAKKDDRQNYSSPVLLRPTVEKHPILNGLPWDTAPGVGGFNLFEAKEGATVLLQGVRTQTSWRVPVAEVGAKIKDADVAVKLLEAYPFLVVDDCGEGRVAAFASDVAPHWIGGMVDWGKTRVRESKNLSEKFGKDLFIDVGSDYAKFFTQLLRWTGKLSRR